MFIKLIDKISMKFGYTFVALNDIPVETNEEKVDLREFENSFFAMKGEYTNEQIKENIKIGIARQLPIVFSFEESEFKNKPTIRIRGSIVVAINYKRNP